MSEDIFGEHNIDFIAKELVERITKGGELGSVAHLDFSRGNVFSVECKIEYNFSGEREMVTAVAYTWWSGQSTLVRGFSPFEGELPDFENIKWDSYSIGAITPGATKIATRGTLENIVNWHSRLEREQTLLLTKVAQGFVNHLDKEFRS